ncbi:MAG: hypothetical protein II338_02265 [Bacteroidaceae bacterium]|nr:hypothetical protein [Bacteroidaceae bacterium]
MHENTLLEEQKFTRRLENSTVLVENSKRRVDFTGCLPVFGATMLKAHGSTSMVSAIRHGSFKAISEFIPYFAKYPISTLGL